MEGELVARAEDAALLRRLTQAVLDSGVAAQHEVQMQHLDQIRDFD